MLSAASSHFESFSSMAAMSSLGSDEAFFGKVFLSSSHFGQTNRVCSASSFASAQYQHAGMSALPILCRYAPKHPCPVKACVKWKSICPCFRVSHGSICGISFRVHPPFVELLHLSCHFFLIRRVFSLLACFPSRMFVRSSTMRSMGTLDARTCRASVETVLYALAPRPTRLTRIEAWSTPPSLEFFFLRWTRLLRSA
jgi:hypothetical protein